MIFKIYLISFTFLVTNLGFASEAKKEVIIKNKSQKMSVEVSGNFEKMIAAKHPAFKVLESSAFIPDALDLFDSYSDQTPMALSIDLNGDKGDDYVLLGESKDKYVVLAFVLQNDKWNMYEVKTFKKDEFPKDLKLKLYLTFMKDSELKYKDKKPLSRRFALQIEYLFGQTTAYYFDGKDFKVYQGRPI